MVGYKAQDAEAMRPQVHRCRGRFILLEARAQRISSARFLSSFTLLELVVVIVIIGILAAVAIPQYTRTVEHSRRAEAETYLGAIRGAQLRYFLEHNNYELDNAGLGWNNLDIERPTARYFDYALPETAASTATSIAIATRNTVQRPAGFGAYTVEISTAGEIIASNSAP